MPLDLYQVDAFTDRAFGGNPAAVCLLPAPAPAGWMQAVANEMNLSETAFVHRTADGAFGLRWFTPAIEVELCGHATLASAHVLWEAGWLEPPETARFQTLSGLLTARRGEGGRIELDFPAKRLEPAGEAAGDLGEALGVQPAFVGKSAFDYLVEVAAEREVRGAAPDFGRLRKLPVRGTTSSRASSLPARGWTRIRSRARRTARSGPTGLRSWARRTSSPTRPPREAERCGCGWWGRGSCWEARR
jgi:predicted PhzF superfamily epimerase YddE/YHI9